MERSPGTIVVWLVAAGLAVLLGAKLLGGGGGGAAGEPVRIASGSGGADRPEARGGPRRSAGGEAFVHVAGAVRRAGLYRLPTAARVAVAIERAGGPLPRADLTGVNLAARVQDGQQIVVPGAGGAAAASGGAASGAGVKPSLGSATADQLEQLDGIGPTLAERIVEYRQSHGGFRSLDELSEVEGIGEQRLKSLREALQP